MSWDGYDLIVCENAHIITLDPYKDGNSKCPECGGAIRGRFELYSIENRIVHRINEKARRDAKKLADKILRSNPEEVARRIETLKCKKQQFLAGIQDTLNKYDSEIDKLRGML